jgi:hypothetical protein
MATMSRSKSVRPRRANSAVSSATRRMVSISPELARQRMAGPRHHLGSEVADLGVSPWDQELGLDMVPAIFGRRGYLLCRTIMEARPDLGWPIPGAPDLDRLHHRHLTLLKAV